LWLLPFVSPSRDGKNQATKLETLLSRRDESGGLFIGTSMFLFALMNSAPAELLHPLKKCSTSAKATRLSYCAIRFCVCDAHRMMVRLRFSTQTRIVRYAYSALPKIF
jgi:hypothetical protein